MKRTLMFRTALCVVAVGALLAACGPVKMGAAATVGDDRVTTSELDSTVAQWQDEFAKNPRAGLLQQQAQQQGQRVPYDPDSPHRSALYQLLDFKVWDEVARQQGVTVSQGEVDRLLAGLGGQSNVAASVLANDIPVRFTPDLARVAVIQQQLLQRYGLVPNAQGQVDPTAQQRAAQQLRQAYSAAAGKLKITVNPRFGAFDPAQMTEPLRPVAYGLSKTESGTG
ncbi:MAG TPA: SurA N-terminal domain-containing protein [Streptosporangiaceae bacterium]